MSRLVETVSVGAKAAGEEPKKDLERIAKYIPAEILAFYTLWTQAAATLPWKSYLLPICIVGAAAGVVVTYVYFDRFFTNDEETSRHYHRVISPIAFAIYSYTIMGSVVPSIFVSGIALLATAAITLVSAIAIPRK